MVVIKRGTEDSIEGMVALGRDFWNETSFHKQHGLEYDPEHCAILFKHLIDAGIVQVAWDDEEVVGYIMFVLGTLPFDINVKIATEMVFYVDPSYQRQGIGNNLIKQAENVAKQLGVKFFSMIHLDSVSPKKAEALYDKHSYNLTETVFTKEL